jgi:hypothetical protein
LTAVKVNVSAATPFSSWIYPNSLAAFRFSAVMLEFVNTPKFATQSLSTLPYRSAHSNIRS